MRKDFTNEAFEIAPGEAISGRPERIQAFQILSGSAWVTVEGQSHDYWLSAGDRFEMAPECLTVIQAERETVRVQPYAPSVTAPLAQLHDRLKQRVAALFGQHATAGMVRAPAHCKSC